MLNESPSVGRSLEIQTAVEAPLHTPESFGTPAAAIDIRQDLPDMPDLPEFGRLDAMVEGAPIDLDTPIAEEPVAEAPGGAFKLAPLEPVIQPEPSFKLGDQLASQPTGLADGGYEYPAGILPTGNVDVAPTAAATPEVPVKPVEAPVVPEVAAPEVGKGDARVEELKSKVDRAESVTFKQALAQVVGAATEEWAAAKGQLKVVRAFNGVRDGVKAKMDGIGPKLDELAKRIDTCIEVMSADWKAGEQVKGEISAAANEAELLAALKVESNPSTPDASKEQAPEAAESKVEAAATPETSLSKADAFRTAYEAITTGPDAEGLNKDLNELFAYASEHGFDTSFVAEFLGDKGFSPEQSKAVMLLSRDEDVRSQFQGVMGLNGIKGNAKIQDMLIQNILDAEEKRAKDAKANPESAAKPVEREVEAEYEDEGRESLDFQFEKFMPSLNAESKANLDPALQANLYFQQFKLLDEAVRAGSVNAVSAEEHDSKTGASFHYDGVIDDMSSLSALRDEQYNRMDVMQMLESSIRTGGGDLSGFRYLVENPKTAERLGVDSVSVDLTGMEAGWKPNTEVVLITEKPKDGGPSKMEVRFNAPSTESDGKPLSLDATYSVT